jgi:hypothetical protein
MHCLRRFNHQNSEFLIICILLFVSTNSIYAQSYIGFHAGVNSGKFSGDAPRNFIYKGLIQFNTGFDFNIKLKKDLYLAISPNYLRSGSRLQYPYENEEEEIQEYRDSINLKVQMLTLPIHLNIISENDKWQYIGGFEIGFPVQALADNTSEEIDISDEFNSVMVSMIFGIGYRIPIKASYLTINLGYSQGLTNLASNLEDPDTYMPRIRFTSFRLTTAYMLPIGKARNN